MNVTASAAQPSGSSGVSGGPPDKGISRLLQHSILQLCNEHIGYSHKLQILGVLCMTVDDEQQELVVKVNNTLKRVSPPAKDSQQATGQVTPPSNQNVNQTPSCGQSILEASLAGSLTGTRSEPVALYNNNNNSSSAFSVPNPLVASGPGYSTDSVNEGEGSTTPVSPAPSPVENGRKSHGRKRSKPMRVDHVYDEGETIEEGDGDIMTVIPTDPDNPQDDNAPPVQNVYIDDPSDDDDDEVLEEDDEDDDSLPPPKRSPKRVPSQKPAKSTASPSVRALLQQSIARKGSSSEPPQPHSQLRSALLNTTPSQSLTLPICVAPEERRALTNGDALEDESENQLHIDESPQNTKDPFENNMDDSGVSVKEEPRDEYDWSRAGQITNPAQLEAISLTQNTFSGAPLYAISSPAMDGVTSLPTYSGLSLALTTANLQLAPSSASNHDAGLSIRYTPTGPITVGANGKNVSQSSVSTPNAAKVKDIILYDDQSPLNQQKGARLETDFMVDKMGLEGRKRRRRAPDETLTLEEIAEYMGATNGMDASIGRGTFQCKYCPLLVEELIAYLQHTLAVHNAYICHQCGKSFTTKSSLLRHRPIHTGMRRFACSICKKTFYRKDKCKAHIKRHLGDGSNAEASPITE